MVGKLAGRVNSVEECRALNRDVPGLVLNTAILKPRKFLSHTFAVSLMSFFLAG